MQVSLVLSLNELHDGQNHLLLDVNVCGLRKLLKEVWMSDDIGRVITSRDSSETDEQKHVLQVIVILWVLVIRSLAGTDIPITSSKTCCKISAASCCLLKSNWLPVVEEIFHFRAHKKFEGSTANVSLFFTVMLRLMAFNMGDTQLDSEGTLFHSDGNTLNACNIELA